MQFSRTANRYWLHSPLSENKRLRMCTDAERRYGHIGERIVSALAEPQISRSNSLVKPVTDAGLAGLIDLKIDGNDCFATTSENLAGRHSAPACPFNEPVFGPAATLIWLDQQHLAESGFHPAATAGERVHRSP